MNTQNRSGLTALMLAVNKGDNDTVKNLIAAGADVDVKDFSSGYTATDYAKANDYIDIIQMLKAAGAKE